MRFAYSQLRLLHSYVAFSFFSDPEVFPPSALRFIPGVNVKVVKGMTKNFYLSN